jgi:hypothetical protein
MEPTPIFADLAHAEREPERSAHREGRSVTDLLRALRAEAAVGAGPPAFGGRRVGHVPDLLSF